MRSFAVRAARPSDHTGLAALLAELLDRPDLTPELASALNTNLLRMLSTPGTSLLVAEDDTSRDDAAEPQVIGFVSLWSRWGLLDEAPSGWIDRIVVRSSYQESSAPYALLEQAIGACEALGCTSVAFVPAEGSLVPHEGLARFGFVPSDLGWFQLELR